jgi:hypothetical protein
MKEESGLKNSYKCMNLLTYLQMLLNFTKKKNPNNNKQNKKRQKIKKKKLKGKERKIRLKNF